jgi:hypothetical protein
MGLELEGFELIGFELRLLEFFYKIVFTPGDAKNDDPMLLFIRLLGFRVFFIGSSSSSTYIEFSTSFLFPS